MNASSTSKAIGFLGRGLFAAVIPILFLALPAHAAESTIYSQCPDTDSDGEPGPEIPGIRCIHLTGGDGYVTMADGSGLYIFSFAELPQPGQDGAPTQGSGLYSSWVMDQGMLAANAPAPTISVDEGDEVYLTLTNAGMAIRPDLFDPHTVHWHGFPQASSVFDGVPDASISINMGASLTYYYKANDPGTYMYHCHVEATEHMQMGMLGNLYVRPRQERCGTTGEPACPAGHTDGDHYAYNDGDGSTRFQVEKEIQIGSFDKAFHDASESVQPLPFRGMHDTYFLLNGRGYPDTVVETALTTTDPLVGREHVSQPVSSLIEAVDGQKILLRISNLNVTQFNTLKTNGPDMQVIALDARLLRDDLGNDMYYSTNSLTLGGGQSADVIIDTTGHGGNTYFLYSANLDFLANDDQNIGGMMTEIRISSPTP